MSRPTKKRGHEDSVAIVEAEGSQRTVRALTTTNVRLGGFPSLDPFVLEQQIESLKAELEHERSLRALDQKRAQHARERLEKQIEIATEEAHEATTVLEDFRKQSERITEQLRQSRNQAMAELRKVQIERLESSTPAGSSGGHPSDFDYSDDDGDQHERHLQHRHTETPADAASMSNVWKEKCRRLEHLLEVQKAKEVEMQKRFSSLRSELETQTQKRDSILSSPPKSPAVLEDAPPAVMKELNRIRISLADTERRERQLIRKVEDLQKRNQVLIQEREEGRLATERLPLVKEQLNKLQTSHENLVAQHKVWKDFGESLEKALSTEAGTITARGKRSAGPPELSFVQRFLEDAKTRVTDLEQQKVNLVEQNQQMKASLLPLETQVKTLTETEHEAQQEKRQVERKLEQCQRLVTQLEAQQSIYLREIENLQSLIKTLDDLPLASAKGLGADSPLKAEHSIKTLELSLASAQEELKVIKAEKERVSKESEDTHAELQRVLEKFGKIRDALHGERAKAEQAGQRANEAEALAGKGSFNPETTRVLHLKETPLAEALKEEIKVLQKQLEAANSGSAKASSSSSKHHDPDKLNKRLKENFQEQIALFRQGVYLMTGYKIDMIPGTDRPTFRVRSMFAEQEEDNLILKWPKTDEVTALDILNTPLAKVLAASPSYDYMTKFHSLPAFMASVQLSLFEKQTVMIT